MSEDIRIVSAADLAWPVDWPYLVDAIEAGHRRPKAVIDDVLLGDDDRALLSRAAWIDGLGFGVKSVTAMACNSAAGLPTIHGAMLVFDDRFGRLRAVIDNAIITNLKTAADSVLGARYLARPDSRTHLVIGAGTVARQVIAAYRSVFPQIDTVMMWNRTAEKARRLAKELGQQGHPVHLADDLAEAARRADIVTTATMSRTPVLAGSWIRPGTHVDLIGAFRPDMREADDDLIREARIFVDSRETTLEKIGELRIPLEQGTIAEHDIEADLYQLAAGAAGRRTPEDITLFKNGGGAHLDLMIADALLRTI